MTRIGVYVTDELKRNIRMAAIRENKAEAQVIRERLEESFRDEPTIGDTLGSLIELGKRLDLKLPPDTSTKIDTYLYEDQ